MGLILPLQNLRELFSRRVGLNALLNTQTL